jgi:ABC-2 type transport system permease protein
MAVYRQRYKSYDGGLTLPLWRFWVLTRFGAREVFASKMPLVFFVLSFVPMLGGVSMIYLSHNLDTLLAFDFPVQEFISIDATFFATIMGIQSTLSFILASIIGPGLVSPDLTNGALPLYLSRPFSRTEYTLGKFSVLAVLLSLITWIPGLVLFLINASMTGDGWLFQNLRIATAIFVGSWAWILTVSLLALALSAWVRWRAVAGAVLFGIFFAAGAFSAVFNEILGTDWGTMMNLSSVIVGLYYWLFNGSMDPRVYPLPVWTTLVSLAIVWTISAFLLARKVRAYEVVR